MFNLSQCVSVESGNAPNQFGRRYGADTLGVKGTRFEAFSMVGHFKTGIAQGGGSRNISDPCPLVLEKFDTEDDGGSNFLGQTEINQPDVAAFYCGSCHWPPSPSSASSMAKTSEEVLREA